MALAGLLTVEEWMVLYAGYYPRSRSIRDTLDLVGLADHPTMRCGQRLHRTELCLRR